MAKRYYLCPVDAVEDPEFGTLYQPRVARYGVSYTAVIPTDPESGKPTSDWCLALVATDNHAALAGDPNVDPLPEFPLDAKVSALQRAASQGMQRAMSRRGIALDLASADGYRDVIRGIGRRLQADFDENNFDCRDA